ncbi:hypothetical protein IPM09_03160 [Candidatus Saccharibacteria bacterium]|nr:MAG: hypothetical protein IPM09_03160 [Candidatus Saccharibacteria bacterium]
MNQARLESSNREWTAAKKSSQRIRAALLVYAAALMITAFFFAGAGALPVAIFVAGMVPFAVVMSQPRWLDRFRYIWHYQSAQAVIDYEIEDDDEPTREMQPDGSVKLEFSSSLIIREGDVVYINVINGPVLQPVPYTPRLWQSLGGQDGQSNRITYRTRINPETGYGEGQLVDYESNDGTVTV